MLTKSRLEIGVLIGLVLGMALSITHGVFAERETNGAVPLDELRAFTDVYARIKKDYVEEVDDKTLLQNAIRGMLSGLDPHSAYLTEEEFQELQIGTTGEFGGLGIEVGMEDGFVKVISPIDDTPAQRAGVMAGDLIIRLDDKPVKGMTLNDAVKLMRGRQGTTITLTIVREGVEKPLKLPIMRDVIQVQSVKHRMLEPGFGYVRITNFQSKTPRSLDEAVEGMVAQNKGQLKGMVLDLRNNPGGVLTGAVGVSDAFLDSGLIVYTEGRVEDSELKYSATKGDILSGAPLVVLINGGSASASEIVAGAVQDHKRGIVMGSRSFGKGSVQTILPLKENTALKLTTARYFTPLGNSIQAEGIEPDIKLENLQVTEAEADDLDPITEEDLSGHLENGAAHPPAEGAAKPAKPAKPGEKQNPAQGEDEISGAKDYQLGEALNLLKGLYILKQRS
jgi:carboxyl-terminal processing protease